MKQIDFNYHNGRKGNWRRTSWNQIVSRIKHPRDAVVLYLAGNGDLDRPVALNKGFSPNNLIAVEKDKSVLERIRDQGTLCVAGEFFDAVTAIALKRKVDVIFGDFCCGLEFSLITKLFHALLMPNLQNTVFAFNFLRGRDASSNRFREEMRQWSQLTFTSAYHSAAEPKHRGRTVLCAAIYWRFRTIYVDVANQGHWCGLTGDAIDKFVLPRLDLGWTDSYPSGIQIFDSVVFKNPFSATAGRVDGGWDWTANTTERKPLSVAEVNAKYSSRVPTKTKLSAGAIMAHRTMRLNGDFN